MLTIEGLAAPDGPLHPMQEAFRENHGLQCGFCTPGMVMTAVDMVRRKGNELDEHTIRQELDGNLCRCTGYHNIVKAIAAGAKAMKGRRRPRRLRSKGGPRARAGTDKDVCHHLPSAAAHCPIAGGLLLLARAQPEDKLLAGGEQPHSDDEATPRRPVPALFGLGEVTGTRAAREGAGGSPSAPSTHPRRSQAIRMW